VHVYVSKERPTVEVDGQVYRFCSESCRRKFECSPERYVNA